MLKTLERFTSKQESRGCSYHQRLHAWQLHSVTVAFSAGGEGRAINYEWRGVQRAYNLHHSNSNRASMLYNSLWQRSNAESNAFSLLISLRECRSAWWLINVRLCLELAKYLGLVFNFLLVRTCFFRTPEKKFISFHRDNLENLWLLIT